MFRFFFKKIIVRSFSTATHTLPTNSFHQQLNNIKNNPQTKEAFNQMQKEIKRIIVTPENLTPVTPDDNQPLSEIMTRNGKHSTY